MSDARADAAAADPDGQAQPCPACGYDMRYATDDRCTECGIVVDRADLLVSGVPWSRRKSIGSIRAFAGTIWLFTLDARRSRRELAKPQSPRDARGFWRRNALCVALALNALLAALLIEHDLQFAMIQPGEPSSLFPTGTPMSDLPGYAQDLAVPWCAGIGLRGTLPASATILALYLTGAARPLMRRAPRSAEAMAVATYAAAPLAWLLPAAIVYVVAHRYLAADLTPPVPEATHRARHVLNLASAAIAGLAVVLFLVRSATWYARARHGGLLRWMAGAAMLVGFSLGGGVLTLGLVPWCFGMLWIVWDSFH